MAQALRGLPSTWSVPCPPGLGRCGKALQCHHKEITPIWQKFKCIYLVLKCIDKIPSHKQLQLDLEGEGMVFSDALAAGLAASSDLFPAPVLKALLFLGCCVAQLVQLVLGVSQCQGKQEGSCHGHLRAQKCWLKPPAGPGRTGAERGAHLCAENRVFSSSNNQGFKPLSIFKGVIFMSGLW